MEGVEEESKVAERAKESSEPEDSKDPGETAPHGDSSDEEDEQLAENLRRATSVVTLTPREGASAVSGPRSAEVDSDEEESQSMITSSKVTVVELEGDARADSQVSKITDPEEAEGSRDQG